MQRYCELNKWNSTSGRCDGRTEDIKVLNAFLHQMEHTVYDAHRQLVFEGAELNLENLKNKIFGIKPKSHLLCEIFEQHNKNFEALVGKEYSYETYKHFKTALKKVQAFIAWKYKVSDFPVDQLKHTFITDFEFYLKSQENLHHNTVMGIIKKLKKVIRICIANDWLEKDPFMSYKVAMRETSRAYLSASELETVLNKKIEIERLSVIRDIFIFSCYTGLSYIDVQKLTTGDIALGIDDKKWVLTERTKTGTDSRIPLLPIAEKIIERYSEVPRKDNMLLPVISNQRINSYLKELADICKINKPLTFHCARHTFATTVTLSNGVPIESVSKMLGHRSLRTTQIYAKVLDVKVSHDMNLLQRKLMKRK